MLSYTKSIISFEVKNMPIKDSITKIGKYLENGAQNIGYKSGQIFEVSKINMGIASKEKAIEEIYMEIGRKLYKDYKANKLMDKSLTEKCEEITRMERSIASMKKKVLKLKDKKLCKKCGYEMERNASFCPKCGKEQQT
jgi:lipopolysaccharide biosynthesis regulator YciM